ncbi:hypothetical protein [Chryseobacterium sp. EO14]|uniref:hypothetical protein n=1 Tax=Chryseobacterium sp. EO14 TaxID=2950551 RepID=UPI00210DE734|nr:hypothetical protein [Chryseobacterium sp. EO14]MCQ4141608.1 hypothetical protein [Chryseobacterium sp. EO14]
MEIMNQIICSLIPGILHSSQVFRYKTKDGRAIFSFSYEYVTDHYEIPIHSHPDYNGRDESSQVAHWLNCSESPINRKICFTIGNEPKTLEKAKKISMEYAELTWTYIKTGISIDNQMLGNY